MKIALLVNSVCRSSIDRLELLQERLAAVQPAGRQVGGYPADGYVAVGQPRPAQGLEQKQNLLPLAKGPHERREAAQVQAVAAGGHQVAGDPIQLAHDDPQVPQLLRRLETHELLHRQGPAEVHVHAGQVVQPVDVGHELPRRQVLADLFRRAVQVADVRRGGQDHLAVGPQHQPQHAVRAGMLRAHVHQQLVAAEVELNQLGIHPLDRHRFIESFPMATACADQSVRGVSREIPWYCCGGW